MVSMNSGRPSTLSLASLSFVGLLSLLSSAEARRWEDVISVSIYAQSHVDIPRIQYSLEADPFGNFPSPSMYQSEPPSDAPSSVPSYFADPNESIVAQSSSSVTGNGNNKDTIGQNCPDGESSFRINKVDTWGDGWGETFLAIREVNSNLNLVQTTSPPGETTFTISKDVQVEDYISNTDSTGSANRTDRSVNETFNDGDTRKLQSIYQGGLRSGGFEAEHVCLSHTACYEVTLQDGKWQEEAKWEIVPASALATSGSAVAKGQGFTNCTFYISDNVVDHPSCPFTCKSASGNNAAATDSATTEGNPFLPKAAVVATDVPSGAPSDAPSLVPTMIM